MQTLYDVTGYVLHPDEPEMSGQRDLTTELSLWIRNRHHLKTQVLKRTG